MNKQNDIILNEHDEMFDLRPGEFQDDYLYRIGMYKETGAVHATWPQLAVIFNNVLRTHLSPWDESSWRKRFYKLQKNPPKKEEEVIIDADAIDEIAEDEDEDLIAYELEKPVNQLSETECADIILRDIRNGQNRIIRTTARTQSIQAIMEKEIRRYEPLPPVEFKEENETPKAMYAMLSDIHYGIEYKGRSGSYSPAIARYRVMYYANRLCQLGFENNIDTIYVSLMGDMISGVIHQTIRYENRLDLVQQIIGASELVSEFLYTLAKTFKHIIVNSVPGNHSRIDKSFEDAARGEKLDEIITWHCQIKLEDIESIEFVPNDYDVTMGVHKIFGKTYLCVHGDLDKTLEEASMRIQPIMEDRIDYVLAGHMHVPELRFEHVGYIRNGSVCGSGDDYTVKKRLFSPPYQVCMLVSENGVDAIYPIRLDKEEKETE